MARARQFHKNVDHPGPSGDRAIGAVADQPKLWSRSHCCHSPTEEHEEPLSSDGDRFDRYVSWDGQAPQQDGRAAGLDAR